MVFVLTKIDTEWPVLRRDLFLTAVHSCHTVIAQSVYEWVFAGTLDNLAAFTKSFPLGEAKTR